MPPARHRRGDEPGRFASVEVRGTPGGYRVLYTVQVSLDGDRVAASVAEIWRWLDREHIKPPVFRYRMTAADIALRLDFELLRDAAEFAEAFGGAVLGRTEQPAS
jgi:hypothetical protein